MNKHKNNNVVKVPWRKQPPEGITEIAVDTMPVEVATEMLLDPLVRINAATRRNCIQARQRFFQSTRERKPADEKILAKLAKASIGQLAKWVKRCATRRMEAQRAYLRVDRITGPDEVKDALRETLNLKAIQYDAFRDACEAEIARRHSQPTAKQDIDPRVRRHKALIAAVSCTTHLI